MIKNIIFDFGGIILDIDYGKTAEQFKKLGARNFDLFYSQAKQNDLFSLFETGKISAAKFRHILKEKLYIKHISDALFDQAWNAMLLGIPQDRIELLKKLKGKFKIFLFSNINEIHFKALIKVIEELNPYFDAMFFSHTLGYRKPDQEAFKKVIATCQIDPKSTLFLDDTTRHVEGAFETGLHSNLLPSNTLTEEVIRQVMLKY